MEKLRLARHLEVESERHVRDICTRRIFGRPLTPTSTEIYLLDDARHTYSARLPKADRAMYIAAVLHTTDIDAVIK